MKATEQYYHVVLFIMLVPTFTSVDETPVWPFKWKLLSSTIVWYCHRAVKLALTLTSVGETLEFDHLNKSYLGVLLCSYVYYAVQEGSNF